MLIEVGVQRDAELVQHCPVPIAGADIVEMNPLRDEHDRTAMVAVKLIKEFAARMLE